MPVITFSVTVTGFDLVKHAVRNSGKGAKTEVLKFYPEKLRITKVY